MGKTDALGRRRRDRRQPSGKRIGLRPRDLLWFEKLHQHGPLPTSYLYAFSEHLARDRTRGLKRLSDLYHEGQYLDRPIQQFHTIDARYNQLVYALGDRGIAVLKEAGTWSPYNTNTGGPWVHRMMVSCITASLELGTEANPNLRYIPQHQILERANQELRAAVTYQNPATRKQETKNLIPDAVCGIEYRNGGNRCYRFFLIEADRHTEPTTSNNPMRKSFARSVAQYREFIGTGQYKEHFGLSAPLMLLNVTTNARHQENFLGVVTRLSSQRGNSYLCFQHVPAFARPFKPPSPILSLLSGPWQRAELPEFFVDMF